MSDSAQKKLANRYLAASRRKVKRLTDAQAHGVGASPGRGETVYELQGIFRKAEAEKMVRRFESGARGYGSYFDLKVVQVFPDRDEGVTYVYAKITNAGFSPS